MHQRHDIPEAPLSTWEPCSSGALSGVQVLDLSRFIAGPLCAQNLGDLGADVIKVERIGGEDTRRNEPQYGGKSLYTALFNRNKRAMTLNTRSEEGQRVLRDLVAWADVVVENFRPGTLDKMGLDQQAMQELNPTAIIVSISGFGQTGPNRDRALFDCIAQAMSGLMSLNAEPGGPPLLTKIFPADSLAAVYATTGALTGLYHRERTGEGQVVDLAVFDSLFAAMGTSIPAYLVTGALPDNNGNRDDYNAPANVFPTVDGHVYIHAGTPAFWTRFCTEVLARPELAADPRFDSVPTRMANQAEVERLVGDWTSTRSSAAVEAAFLAAEIPCGAVANVVDAAENPQAWARDMLLRTTDSDGDEVVLLGNPVKLSRTPTALRLPPPQTGEHTDQVLCQVLGYDHIEITKLREVGAV